MKRKQLLRLILFLILSYVFIPITTSTAEDRVSISDREIIERLTRLEEGQKALREQMLAGQRALREQMLAGQKALREQMLAGQEALREEMKSGQASLQAQIDRLRDLVLGGFAVIFAGIFTLIGFVIWDRRTALSPVIRKTKELEERDDLTLRALKEYARKEPRMAEVLKTLGLL